MLLRYIPFFLLLTFHLSQAQVTNEGNPKSWSLNLDSEKTYVMPRFDLESLQKEDEIRDKSNNQPYRFGFEHMVSLGFKDGQWHTLENGDRIWQINIKSKGAKTLNFMFDEFYLPKGAKLYFYNNEKTDVLGAYTSSQNRDDMQFGSWLIDGDNIWIEYYEPRSVNFKGQLHISKVVHGYRSMTDIPEFKKVLNQSAACNQDVDCPVGNDFDDIKNELKKSVAMTIVNSSGFCSGTLINNTQNDRRQYFLTANHCLGSPVNAWAFRFNWISPDPSCSTTVNSTNGSFDQTVSGATLLASNSKSDFALLEINAPLPLSWGLVWSGWDRSGSIPDFTVGIHHPRGDIMKVSRDNDSPVKNSRLFNGNNDMENWYLSEWELGVTEPGSSGSALFDQNGRIVGQLAGGAADCNGTINNGAFDFYGRFDVSWDFGNSIDSRLKEWLDPNNSGALVLNQYPPAETFSYDVALVVDDFDEPICSDESVPTFTIFNNGTETITSALLTYQIGSNPQQTISWTGNLETDEISIIGTPTLDLTQGNELQADLTITGIQDEFQDNNSFFKIVNNYQNQRFTADSITFTLITDEYASETSWALYNDSGELIEESPQSLSNETEYIESYAVEPGRCYELVIFDEAGDGICCNYGEGSFKVETNTGELIAQGGEFGAKITIDFRINEILNTSDFEFNVFHNPVTSVLSIDGNTDESIEVSIFDLSGKLIYTENASENIKISTSTFSSGIYFVKVNGGNNSVVKKIIKE